MTASKPALCAILPALNEEARIAPVVAAVARHGVKVIVVDDGSSDRTAQIAAEAGAVVMRHASNRGKGAAIRTGFARLLAECYDAVITLDADGQHDPAEIPLLVRALGKTGAGIVNGNRMHSCAGMPGVRVLCNRRGSAIVSAIAGQSIPDALIGYRIIRMDLLRAVFPHLAAERYEIDPEIVLRAALAGYTVVSVDVRCVYGGERSRIRPLLDAYYFLKLVHSLSRVTRGRR